MKLILTSLFSTLLTTMSLAQNSPFKTYQWKNRLLIIYMNGEEGESTFNKQTKLFEDSQDGFEDRDIISIRVTDTKITSLESSETMDVSIQAVKEFISVEEKDTYQITLIGKDGTIKLQQNEPLSTKKLFSIIDAMPMRKREMRNTDNY